MNMHSCKQHSSTTAGSKRYPLLTLTLGTLLIAALTPAVAQQEVRQTPFEAHAPVHASSPSPAMETTMHAPSDMAILRNKQLTTVPKPQQPRTPTQACPPGSRGMYPHCVPRQAPRQSPQQPSHTRYTDVSHAPSSTFKPTTHKPPHVYTAKQRSLHAPTGPGPAHAGTANNANSHSIIFVGGHAQPLQPGVKQSLNPQPIPPGHALHSLQPGVKQSLNPQPIPPGHAMHPLPPGSPIKPAGH